MKMFKTMREVEIVETKVLRRREEERYVRSCLSLIAVCIHFAPSFGVKFKKTAAWFSMNY